MEQNPDRAGGRWAGAFDLQPVHKREGPDGSPGLPREETVGIQKNPTFGGDNITGTIYDVNFTTNIVPKFTNVTCKTFIYLNTN